LKRVLFAGEINVDLVLQGYEAFPSPGQEVLVQDSRLVLGSATAIMAMGLARLGTPVGFVGKVGDDLFGSFCLEDMASRGIDVSRVVRDPGLKTGVTVSISHPGDRALVTHLGAITALTGADVPDAALAGADHLHVSSFFFQQGLRPGLPALFARARRAGLTTSLDTGFDPSGRWDAGLREVLQQTDLFFPNEVELSALSGCSDPTAGLRALANGVTRIVAKLGERGAMTLDGGEVVAVPAYRVEPVDTTGAGDSFNAGFLQRWLDQAPLVDCLRLGAACGALSTSALGGTAGQPTLAEAEAFVQARA
jgi:sugar/nucleoside kinase (ribokinase family)